jgi:hypothetical protein
MLFRFAAVLMLTFLTSSTSVNAVPNSVPAPHKETLRGYLVDLVCIKEEAGKVSDFGPAHTKKCLQMPTCSQGGYALLLPTKEVLAFDDNGNSLAHKLIAVRNEERGFIVKVSGTRGPNVFHVQRIE